MREILFRGKRVDNGEWVYGAFCPDVLEIYNKRKVPIGFIRKYNAITGKMEMFEVDRETVGQSTGICDKNGIRIFEGDIVKILYTDWMSNTDDNISLEKYLDSLCKIGKVFFDKSNLKYSLLINNCKSSIICGEHGYIKIIGNIHDNKELLGEQSGNRC